MLIVPPTIELVAYDAKSAYADWEMEIDRIRPAIFITTVLLYRFRWPQL